MKTHSLQLLAAYAALLRADPDELSSAAGKREHAARQTQLRGRLHAWFARYADPKWDLWKGGKSKSRVGTQKAIDAALGR